jgi:WD40 repeat protein
VASGLNTVTLSGVENGLMAFSPDGKTLASAHWGGPVQLWDVPAAQRTDK